jgi:hypothetical protein
MRSADPLAYIGYVSQGSYQNLAFEVESVALTIY